MSNPSYISVIKNRGFTFLWINQILMQLATNALNFTLIIWVYKLTNSNFAVSALILSIYLPALLFGIFAGVFVDITSKKKIITVVDFLLALAVLSFPLIKTHYFLILLNTFIINSLNQFFIPAESSSIPQLVPKKLLFLANSLFSLTLYGSFMLGYSLAGPIFDLFGIDSIFYLGGSSLLLACLVSQNLPPLRAVTNQNKLKLGILTLITTETSRTFNFIRGKLSIMTSIGLLSGIQMGIGILAVMVSSYMERVLKIQATNASYVLMLPLGLGMVVGALLIGRLFHGIPRRFIVRPAILLSGILLFSVGIAPSLLPLLGEIPAHLPRLRHFLNAPSLSTVFALGAFLLGICSVAIIIPSQTVLQENTPPAIRGKIFAVLAVMMNIVAIVPIILAGGLADLFGETTVFMGLGVIVFTVGLVALFPALFFSEHTLPFNIREFLGLGHWKRDVS